MISYEKGQVNEEGQFITETGRILDVVFLDFETFYSTGYTLQSLTYPEYAFDERFKFHGVGLAINHGEYEWVTGSRIEEVFKTIAWDNVVLVVQNALFDAPLILWKFGIRVKHIHDTKSFSNAIYPGQHADLGYMLKREFPDDPSMWKGKELADFKGVRDLNPKQEHIMGNVYCRKDTLGMRALWYRWVVQMPYSEIRLQNETIQLYLEPKFHLNVDLVEEALEEEKAEERMLVKNSNYNKTTFSSNPKFKELLESLGLKVPMKISPTTHKPTPALAQSDPELIRLMADNPQFKHIWDARRAVKSTGQKSKAARLIQLASYFEGMIPVPLNYGAAHTLRWGGTQKVNHQSIKRKSKLRKAHTAPKGYYVYVVDSSNIEARKVSWLAGETKALDMFRRGEDTYNDMATKIYGYPVERKKELPDGTKPFEEEGNVGKTARLGLGYGMGALKFQNTLASGPMGADPIYKPFDFCQAAVNIFRQDNPNIVNYWKLMQQAIYDMMLPGTHYYIGPLLIEYEKITFPNGLSLKYPNIRHRTIEVRRLLTEDHVVVEEEKNLYCDRKDGEKHQKLYGGIVAENVTQRGSRDIVAEQTLEVIDYFQDVRTGLLVHDEGVFIMPDDHPDERMRKLIEIYSTPRPWCPDIPLAAEGGYAPEYSK